MQNQLFLSAGILLDAYFSSSSFRFSAGIQHSRPRPTDGKKKEQNSFFISEKRQVAFLSSKKGQGAILTFKRRQGTILTFNKRAGSGTLRKT